MNIRCASTPDIPAIMTVLEAAKGIMRADGNTGQWVNGYPSREVVEADISSGSGFVAQEGPRIVAYFAFIPSPDPTYSYIEGGAWVEDTVPYHVVHRIGSVPDVHGVFRAIMDWCFEHDGNIRIDTHRDNHIMQHCITGYGFTYCGIIYLADGAPRLAYQKLARS